MGIHRQAESTGSSSYGAQSEEWAGFPRVGGPRSHQSENRRIFSAGSRAAQSDNWRTPSDNNASYATDVERHTNPLWNGHPRPGQMQAPLYNFLPGNWNPPSAAQNSNQYWDGQIRDQMEPAVNPFQRNEHRVPSHSGTTRVESDNPFLARGNPRGSANLFEPSDE